MNSIVHCLLKNRDYRSRKHKVEAGKHCSTYTYDGFCMIQFYHTLNILCVIGTESLLLLKIFLLKHFSFEKRI